MAEDRIILGDCRFWGCHGVYEEEKREKQQFRLDLTLFLDLANAGRSDDLRDTVDYALLYDEIKTMVEDTGSELLENLASRIAELALARPRVSEVEVSLEKCAARSAGGGVFAPRVVIRRRQKSTLVALSLGANLGDRKNSLSEAAKRLAALSTAPLRKSSLYQTEPWGELDQPPFLNAVVLLDYDKNPLDLLREIHRIENDLGRKRLTHWGARTIDIDIILFGEQTLAAPELKIPHPYLAERAFVLIPLAEVAPHLFVPGLGRVEELAQAVSPAGVEKLEDVW